MVFEKKVPTQTPANKAVRVHCHTVHKRMLKVFVCSFAVFVVVALVELVEQLSQVELARKRQPANKSEKVSHGILQ